MLVKYVFGLPAAVEQAHQLARSTGKRHRVKLVRSQQFAIVATDEPAYRDQHPSSVVKIWAPNRRRNVLAEAYHALYGQWPGD